MKCSKQSGFTLVELAVVLLIAGLVIASTISMVQPYMQSVQRNTTRAKLENISQALALFAQQYGRLPCPGDPRRTDTTTDPFGSPRNAGTNGTDIVANSGCGSAVEDYKGIVPFRALGLDESQVRDSYNNLITYAVTPGMTLYQPLAIPAVSRNVNNACRVSDLWIDTTTGLNKNVRKAHVCCAPLSGISGNIDINIFSERAKLAASRILPERNKDNPNFGNANVAANVTNFERPFVAFILISHGGNGDGAFIKQTEVKAIATLRSVTTNNTITQETENRDHGPGPAESNNLDYITRSNSTTDNVEYYDDIVVWKTNDQLINMFGNDSCSRP